MNEEIFHSRVAAHETGPYLSPRIVVFTTASPHSQCGSFEFQARVDQSMDPNAFGRVTVFNTENTPVGTIDIRGQMVAEYTSGETPRTIPLGTVALRQDEILEPDGDKANGIVYKIARSMTEDPKRTPEEVEQFIRQDFERYAAAHPNPRIDPTTARGTIKAMRTFKIE